MTDDLRVIKTKQQIKTAFLDLRATKPVNRITVKSICELALINKSTFYAHYQDVFVLADTLQKEAIDALFDGLTYKDSLLTDPSTFIKQMPEQAPLMQPEVAILFRDESDSLYEHMAGKLLEYYMPAAMTPEAEIRLAFIIGGATTTMKRFMQSKQYSPELLEATITQLIKSLT
ncbi:TetR/AcrR family transcriptional regulator [Lacticaseibacillus pantheris]